MTGPFLKILIEGKFYEKLSDMACTCGKNSETVAKVMNAIYFSKLYTLEDKEKEI
jgi:hypothetical protein